MSTNMRLTLIGMYNYDAHLFDNLLLPDGYDKETFINSLLLEHGEKCVLYTDVDFVKFTIGALSRKWNLELQRIYDALTAEYDPISNYDRHEEITDVRKSSGKSKTKADYNTLHTPDTSTTDEVITPNISEHKVSAYNSSGYENDSQDITSQGKTKTTQTGTDNVNVKGDLSDNESNNKEKFKHVAHIYGNIGVTTSTAMVSEVVEQRVNVGLYDVATRIFANELLINIY